ncbi:MAG: DUF503 domain-containing protein [Phycisphaerales bacterium]
MIIAVLQVELDIPGAESLKDKRRVVKSLKDRLHREHLVSVAEVAAQESHTTAVIGIAAVGTDGRHLGVTLDRIGEKLRSLHDAEVVATRRHMIVGDKDAHPPAPEPVDHDLVEAMLARARAIDPEDHRAGRSTP